MSLREYVSSHCVRGACTCGKCIDRIDRPEEHQPKGHTADLVFFEVAMANDPDKEIFESMARSEYSHWFDGNEHTYLETGADMGDQGIALMTMGLGALLEVWELMTPNNLMPFLPEEMRRQMAGSGLISIKVK